MQDTDKPVNIDTSGPGAEVELDSVKEELIEETIVEEKPGTDKSYENERETKLEDGGSADDAIAKSDEPTDVQASEENTEKKKELEEYSEGVKRRIAKLTKKMRESERREEAATIYAKSVLAEKEALSSRLAKLDTGFVSEKENRIKSGMEAAVAKLAKAREESDLKAEVAATAEISRLGYEEARLADLKARQAEQKTQASVPQQPIQQQEVEMPRQVDSRARDWARKNDWFNKDPIMTEGAKVIHRQLTEIEGYDPNTEPEEYYSEVDRRIRLEFPHKFDTNVTQESTRPTQTVASATRANRSSGRKVVKLTPSQVAIAKKLGVPLKDYAEQLKITEGV
jgi:BMFP domain-containing protein YqiC